MSRNSHSIAPIFGEFADAFSQFKIIGLDQRFLNQSAQAPKLELMGDELESSLIDTPHLFDGF